MSFPCNSPLWLVCAGATACLIAQQESAVSLAESPAPTSRATVRAAPKPLAPGAATEDWPTLLGPTYDNKSTETKLLKKWPQNGPTLLWEMNTGEGFSAPVVSGDRLVYFHRRQDQEIIECLHPETGSRYWSFAYPTQYRDRYGMNNGPRCAPVIDQHRVYTYGAEGSLYCLDLQTGTMIWKRNTTSEYTIPQNYFGVGTTPLIEGNLLIVNVGAPHGPCVIAYDKKDGRYHWKAGKEWTAGYATPIPATVHNRRRVFVFTGGDSRPPVGGLLSIDPANGSIDFRFPFRGKRYESANSSSPVVIDDQLFISSSYRTGGVALALKPDGGYEIAWKSDELGAHFATPIHRDGYLYGITGMGKSDAAIVCLDWKTGKRMWRHVPEWTEIAEHNGEKQSVKFSTFMGSMILADGHFLILGELGHLLWADLTPRGYRELQRARLFHAGETFTPPILSRGLLYVCQNRPDTQNGNPPRLLCYDLRGSE